MSHFFAIINVITAANMTKGRYDEKFAQIDVANRGGSDTFATTVFANPYPTTFDNGNLVLVDGGMGVGCYTDRSSVAVERMRRQITRSPFL